METLKMNQYKVEVTADYGGGLTDSWISYFSSCEEYETYLAQEWQEEMSYEAHTFSDEEMTKGIVYVFCEEHINDPELWEFHFPNDFDTTLQEWMDDPHRWVVGIILNGKPIEEIEEDETKERLRSQSRQRHSLGGYETDPRRIKD